MTLTTREVEHIKEIMARLLIAFTWEDTQQGHDYWRTVYANLYELLDNDNLRHRLPRD